MDAGPPPLGDVPDRQARDDETNEGHELPAGLKHILIPPQTSSPMSSAPGTPRLHTPRRESHGLPSPLQPKSLRQPESQSLRRTSSAMSLNSRPGSSAGTPKLSRKGSRQSFGAQHSEEQEKRPTPKKSISHLIANLREAHSTMEAIEEPIILTAPQIAAEHFSKELLSHEDPSVEAETVVILHDACYGHRYSRLKSTKSALSMIVERPERILASVLGASAAYVRLGEHHSQGRSAPHPSRQQAVPPPFKIRRSTRSLDVTSSYVTNVHGTDWMTELRQMCHGAADKLAAGAKELGRESSIGEQGKRALHEGDLYLAPESLNAFQGALGGVADAVDSVFKPATQARRAFVAVRPPGHHCSADYPSGFCWLNNVHVGIEYAAQTYGLTHAAILDFDLHHGDGSQAITWERNSRNNRMRLTGKPASKLKLSPDIGYYSLHDINSYPCEVGDDEKVQAASLCIENAHGQSIWNVHLQPWKTQDEFWELYESRYRVLLEKAKVFLQYHTARLRAEAGGKVQPKAAVFISAGFDASEWEGSGMQRHKVNVPTEFYARFTRDVVELAQEPGLGCDGRVISVLEGGYSDRALCSGVLSHLSGLCAQNTEAVKKEPGLDELMNGLRIDAPTVMAYDRTWWSAANLTALELQVNPPPPPAPGKKMRMGPQPTYATPTESFAYKVVDPNKFARSVSGTMRESLGHTARPPTPPPPEVDWVMATQELSKLLIPTDRQTKSCTADELGGVKVKKERQSILPPTTAVEGSRQLRDRKAKVPARYAESVHSDEMESARSVSRSSDHANRRTTLHDFPIPSRESFAPVETQRRASRRVSAGGALSSVDMVPDSAPPPLPAKRPGSSGVANGNGGMKPPPIPASKVMVSGLDMKKSRAPSKPRQAPLATAPAPFHNTNKVDNSALLNDQESPATYHTASVRSGSNTPTLLDGNGSGVDALTSGMKKVTLKVGTREEHDRKLREKEAADRRARALKGAETRRVNAAAKKAREAAVTGEGPAHIPSQAVSIATVPMAAVSVATAGGPMVTQSASEPLSELNTQHENKSTSMSVAPFHGTAAEVTRQSGSSSLATALPSARTPVLNETTPAPHEAVQINGATEAMPLMLPASKYEDMHPAHQQQQQQQTPSGPELSSLEGRQVSTEAHPASSSTSFAVPHSAARQLLHENDLAHNSMPAPPPPTFGSSSPSVRGRYLPVFSSTGPIPFAATGPGVESRQGLEPTAYEAKKENVNVDAEGKEGDVWDVPETPRH